MGVKKSTVCTSAQSLVRRYTPASSALTEPTRTFGSRNFGSCRKTCDRAFWLNFDAHPAQDESDVSLRICSRDMRSPPFWNAEFGFRNAEWCAAAVYSAFHTPHSALELAERIGIEPTPIPRIRDRQRFWRPRGPPGTLHSPAEGKRPTPNFQRRTFKWRRSESAKEITYALWSARQSRRNRATRRSRVWSRWVHRWRVFRRHHRRTRSTWESRRRSYECEPPNWRL